MITTLTAPLRKVAKRFKFLRKVPIFSVDPHRAEQADEQLRDASIPFMVGATAIFQVVEFARPTSIDLVFGANASVWLIALAVISLVTVIGILLRYSRLPAEIGFVLEYSGTISLALTSIVYAISMAVTIAGGPAPIIFGYVFGAGLYGFFRWLYMYREFKRTSRRILLGGDPKVREL